MTHTVLRHLLALRPTLLVSLALSGCSLQLRPELEVDRPSFYKIRFDSSMTLVGSPRPLYAREPTFLADVIEVGGQAALRRDTVVIAPSYIMTADREHPGEWRTIRTSCEDHPGDGRIQKACEDSLPAVVFIPIRPGVRVEPWSTGPSLLSSIAGPFLAALAFVILFRSNRH